MNLTKEQEIAFKIIIETLKNKPYFLLCGSAGTGKTTLTKHIAKHFTSLNFPICAIAPTHKAKRVIGNILNEKCLYPIPAFTIASIMGKIKEHSYIGTKKYSNPNNKKFASYKLFILDEVSMVADNDLRFIMNYVGLNGKKMLIIGDDYQIPCPSAPYKITNIIVKSDSFIFNDDDIDKYKLTEVVRQCKDSPILTLACFVRDNIDNEFTIIDTEYNNIITTEQTYSIFKELFKNIPLSTKIIAYTNQAVNSHNMEIRRELCFESKFVINEILTGYASIGFPELLIENGQDYIITKIEETINHTINCFDGLHGHFLNLRIPETTIINSNLFFIDINAEENLDFIKELIFRSEKVNALGSTKMDYIKYNELKNMVIFMEDVYKYNGDIFKESDFKETHILLLTKINDIIKDNVILQSKLTDKIETSYPGILAKRLLDTKKPIGDSETLADQFKCIEKDIFYGYAITAHKSQGSTYQNVIVDENDFARIQDKINFRYNKLEKRTREKNQLRYVSYTRPKKELYIIYNDLEK